MQFLVYFYFSRHRRARLTDCFIHKTVKIFTSRKDQFSKRIIHKHKEDILKWLSQCYFSSTEIIFYQY